MSLASMLEPLARLVTPRQKAAENQYRPGPWLTMDGWLPHNVGQYANFWQMGYDPVPSGSCSIIEACVWAYIRAVAQLPGYHRREMDNGGMEAVTTSALSRLLRAPNFYQTSSDFMVQLIRSLLLTGNSYHIAQRNERQEVVALHWTDPRQCRVHEIAVEGAAFKEVFYEVSDNPLFDTPVGQRLVIPARDIFHVKLATPRHPLVGQTWLASLALELGARGAIQAAQTTFAGNMSRPSGVLTTDLTLTAAQVGEMRERWNQQAAGLNAGGVPILTSGLKFQPISVSNEDAQLVDQLKMTDRAITAVFGVPPMLIGIAEQGTTKSAEAQMREWLSSGLGFVLNHVEVAFDQFFGLDRVPHGREWTEYDTHILTRASFGERMDGLAKAVQGGILAPNEARALEGYKAVDEGDEPRVQQQLVPLSFAGKVPAAPAPAAPPPAPANDDKPEPEKLDEADTRALIKSRIQRDMHERHSHIA